MASIRKAVRQPYTLRGYRIRESQRATRISIKVSSQAEVEVVVPPRCDRQRLLTFITEKQPWITATVERIKRDRQSRTSDVQETLPSVIRLRSLGEDWQITYQPSAKPYIRISTPQTGHLVLSGASQAVEPCQQVLRQWVRQKATLHLEPWLRQLSQECQLPFTTVTIRRQKTRWASCSSKKSISLNDKLLFLPPELVRYVMIHELCHTVQLNHSPTFWALVAEKEPDYKQFDTRLRDAWRYVPDWLDG